MVMTSEPMLNQMWSFHQLFVPNFLAALQFTGGEDCLSHLYILELPIGLQQFSVPAAVCQLMHFMG